MTELEKKIIKDLNEGTQRLFKVISVIIVLGAILYGGKIATTPDGRVTINVKEEYVDYTYYTKTQYRLGELNKALLDRAKADYPNGVDESYNVYIIPRSNSITYRIYSPWDSLPTDIKEE